jgi:hypothetical protein
MVSPKEALGFERRDPAALFQVLEKLSDRKEAGGGG